MLQSLLDKGAKTNLTGFSGHTPLSLAHKSGNIEIVNMLEVVLICTMPNEFHDFSIQRFS